MSGLKVAPSFELPLEAATETFAILAVKRAGKSNAAVVIAEEMYDRGIPWVAIDPKGDWWGVRAAGDGQAAGLSVLVFGGVHGDVPLEPTAGRLVADLVVEQRVTCVLDVSEMSKADQRRFLTDFADRLYRRNTEPLHVFCEEADEYIPQRVMGEAAKLVGAFETLVKRGGFRGIGITLITQRSASLNKDVLTQAGTLIAMRTPSPQDRKAVMAWIDYHAASKDVIDELPTLAAGEAWVFSPQWLDTLQKIRFRRRRTFDSGATPKIGGKPRPPARLADVDLAAIKEAMAETIERAKADDPKELRKRIQLLERELAAERAKPTPGPVEIRVEVPVLGPELVDRIEAALSPAASLLGEAQETLLKHRWWAERQIWGETSEEAQQRDRNDVPRARPASAGADPVGTGRRPAQRPDPAPRREPSRAAVPRTAPTEGLTGPQQRILNALAWLRSVRVDPADRTQLALFAEASPKSSAFANNLGALRTAGLIDYPGRGTVDLTAAGADAAQVDSPITTTAELHEALFARLSGPQTRILQALIGAYPEWLAREDVAERAEASPSSSAFANNLGALRTLGFIDYPERGYVVALPVLFLGGDR